MISTQVFLRLATIKIYSESCPLLIIKSMVKVNENFTSTTRVGFCVGLSSSEQKKTNIFGSHRTLQLLTLTQKNTVRLLIQKPKLQRSKIKLFISGLEWNKQANYWKRLLHAGVFKPENKCIKYTVVAKWNNRAPIRLALLTNMLLVTFTGFLGTPVLKKSIGNLNFLHCTW